MVPYFRNPPYDYHYYFEGYGAKIPSSSCLVGFRAAGMRIQSLSWRFMGSSKWGYKLSRALG